MENKPRILPMVWLLLTVLAMAALHWLGPFGAWLSPPWTWLGWVPAVFGFWMAARSARAFQRADTGLIPFDEATALVTDGYFRYSRNPMYLGMAVFLAGLSIVLGCLGSLLPVIGFVIVIHYTYILREEVFMEAAFGEAYLEYKKKVRRWL